MKPTKFMLTRRDAVNRREFLIEKLLSTLREMIDAKGHIHRRRISATHAFFSTQYEAMKQRETEETFEKPERT